MAGEEESGGEDQDAPPPPIPPAEMPLDELARIVDAGELQRIETALREHSVRLPDVLDQVERILEQGWGNLAAALVTMLIASFHISRSDRLADRVLEHKDSAGNDELVDLAAALLGQERLSVATRVLEVVLAREADHGRALYLRARIFARRGLIDQAFDTIARVSPKLLGAHGMAVQARYALLAGRTKAIDGALKHAKKSDDPDVINQVLEVEHMRERMQRTPAPLLSRMRTDLFAAMAIEYGSLLVEVSPDPTDGGRFGMDAMSHREAGTVVAGIAASLGALGAPITELIYATEDGEIIASALAKILNKPLREWRAEKAPVEGSWLCMASAATHPHLPNNVVKTIQAALDSGPLRTLALILPCGWRGPIVPDVIGRITGDDELPWAIDDEVSDVLDEMFQSGDSGNSGDSGAPSVRSPHPDLEDVKPLLRALEPMPRAGHIPFFDETPVPRG